MFTPSKLGVAEALGSHFYLIFVDHIYVEWISRLSLAVFEEVVGSITLPLKEKKKKKKSASPVRKHISSVSLARLCREEEEMAACKGESTHCGSMTVALQLHAIY